MPAVVAEFAGTREECKKFAKDNGLNYARNKGIYPNGFPYVSLPYKNKEELLAVLKRFQSLGWNRDSVIVT